MSEDFDPPGGSASTARLRAAAGWHQMGDLPAAEFEYNQILARYPSHPEALYLSGVLAYQSGASEVAAVKLRRSLEIRPDFLPAIEMLGLAYNSLQNFEQAAHCFEMAAVRQPLSPKAYYRYGHALFNLRRMDDAVAALRQALSLNPMHAGALYRLAVIFRLQGNFHEAALIYSQAINVDPKNASALDEYGGVLFELGRITEADEVIRRAIQMAPGMANPYTNLGRLYQTNPKRAEEALALHDQSIARKPTYGEAHNNRGVALYTLGRFDEAVSSFQRAIALKPTLSEAHANLGQTLLMQGNFAAGWTEYEWRWKCSDCSLVPREFSRPKWEGEYISHGSLLVWGEQGLGDELLYGGMVRDLVTRGISVTWESDPRLVPLLQRSFPGVTIVPRLTPPALELFTRPIRAQVSLTGLGRYLRPDVESFKAHTSYLQADMDRASDYRLRLLGTENKTRLIGISWGSASHDFAALKTSSLKAWAPIWGAAGDKTTFVDLQYGETSDERSAAGLDLTHLDDLDSTNDIDGLAALIRACDFVITVSNTTAHIAGALGVPFFVMVPSGSARLWYWGNGDARSLWYPSATVLKQLTAYNWHDVIARVARIIATSP